MNRSRRVVPLLVLVGGCLAVGDKVQALCPGGVTVFGLENCPLGTAVLGIDTSGLLLVSNVGPSGNDGVEMILPAQPGTVLGGRINLGEPQIWANTTGVYLDVGITGLLNGLRGADITSINHLREDINSSGFASTVTVAPDPTPLGATSYDISMTSNGVGVGQQSGLTASMRIANTGAGLRADTPPVLRVTEIVVDDEAGTVTSTLQWEEPVRILSPGATEAVSIDTLIVVVTKDSGRAGSGLRAVGSIVPETLRVKGKGLLSFTVTGEQVLAQGLQGGSAIPTVSEWSMIILTLLFLTAGAIVLGRRRAVRAAA